MKEQISRYQEYIRINPDITSNVSYTLALHREYLPHRAFAIVEKGEVVEIAAGLGAPQALSTITMVFGGQGAQWPEMGKELILSDAHFRKDILNMDRIMKGLKFPPEWNLIGGYLCLR